MPGGKAMFGPKALGALNECAGLMALPSAIPTAVLCAAGRNGWGHRDRRHLLSGHRVPKQRLGDRPNHRATDQVRAHRRHRRFRPLPSCPICDGELQRLGARHGLVDSPKLTAKPANFLSHRASSTYAERSGGGALYPSDLLATPMMRNIRPRAIAAAQIGTFPKAEAE